jgi:hypothetical protein
MRLGSPQDACTATNRLADHGLGVGIVGMNAMQGKVPNWHRQVLDGVSNLTKRGLSTVLLAMHLCCARM